MSLIEKPLPKDLVGLHMSFGVVPPLVRLRGAELLEVMRKAAENSVVNAEMNSTPLLPPQPRTIPTRTVFEQGPIIAADLWTFSKGDDFHSYLSIYAPESGYRWPSTFCSNNPVFIVRRSPDRHPNPENLGWSRDKNKLLISQTRSTIQTVCASASTTQCLGRRVEGA